MVATFPSYTPPQAARTVPRHGVTRRRLLERALLRRALLALALLLLAFLLLGSSAQAQAGPATPASGSVAGTSAGGSDSKMWYGLSLGGGNTRLACDICDRSRDSGPSVALSFGAYASSRLRIGVEASRWSHDDGGTREHVNALGLVAHLAFPQWRGVYVIGGGGWSGYGAGPYRSDAPRLTVGLGYDVPLMSGWVVGNVLTLDSSWPSAIRTDDVTVVRDAGLSTVRVGLQLHRR